MQTKVLTVKENGETLFLVTYRVCNKNFIVREDVRVHSAVYKDTRYHGKTPIVFVNAKKRENLEALNLANLTKTALDNVLSVKNELDIIKTIKTVLSGKELVFEKEVYDNEFADIKLKRPHKDFVAFSNSMITRIANGIVESVVSKNGKNAS